MTGFEITMIVAAVLALAGLGYVAWLLYELSDALRERDIETRKALGEVKKTFLDADQSFKNLIDTLGAFEQMEQILALVKQSASHLSGAHDKIHSQLDTTGKFVKELHDLVQLWSKEGSALQQNYVRLSEAVEKAIVVENESAVRRNAELQAMLRDHGARAS